MQGPWRSRLWGIKDLHVVPVPLVAFGLCGPFVLLCLLLPLHSGGLLLLGVKFLFRNFKLQRHSILDSHGGYALQGKSRIGIA